MEREAQQQHIMCVSLLQQAAAVCYHLSRQLLVILFNISFSLERGRPLLFAVFSHQYCLLEGGSPKTKPQSQGVILICSRDLDECKPDVHFTVELK